MAATGGNGAPGRGTWIDEFRSDFDAFVSPRARPRVLRALFKFFSEPGLQFVLIMRWQIALEARGKWGLSRLAFLLNLRLTGAEVGHGCHIGSGLVVKHPLGVVIGGGSRIGEDCTILGKVTLGEVRPGHSEGMAYPTIGDHCLIGTGAVILGAITIGSNVTVGANAVVIRDAGSDCTLVGAPATALVRSQG